MANATAAVKKGLVAPVERFKERSSKTLASATTYYENAALAINSSGYLEKFDDTSALELEGFVRGDNGNPALPAGTQGDAALMLGYEQPKEFELTISGVAITDIGRPVYALDDQTGTLDITATTYCNLYGWVDEYLSSGYARVRPAYTNRRAHRQHRAHVDGAVPIRACSMTVMITKATAAALTLADPTSGVHDGARITFIAATAAAHTISNAAGSGFFSSGGSGKDVATLGGAIGDGLTVEAYAGKWYLVPASTNATLG